MDFFEAANALRVVDVWQPGNETGWVTPRVLYDPSVKAADGYSKAPTHQTTTGWVEHGTAGVNTLMFWGVGGSIANDMWTLANYLIPHDQTQYADGHLHDTSNVVFKMVPDNLSCNHAGVCAANVSNGNSKGVEYESLQNGTHDITEMQYMKGALIYAQGAAMLHIPDWRRFMHGIIAIEPVGRRSDPYAGLFRIAHSWELVLGIRRDARIWQKWNLPQPQAV